MLFENFKYKIIKKTILFFAIALVCTKTNAQSIDWAKKFQPSLGGIWTTSIAVDTSFNAVYVTGYFNGVADFDPGTGVYIDTAFSGYDFFIVKLDTAGNFQWAHSFGNISDDKGLAVAADPDGNVILTGEYQNGVDFDPGPGNFSIPSNGGADLFVLKLSAAGNFVWAKGFGGSSYDAGNSIVTDAQSNVYVTGHIYLLKLDSMGNSLTNYSNGAIGKKIIYDDAGFIYIIGGHGGTVDIDPGAGIVNYTGTGGFIAKYDLQLNVIWSKYISAGANDLTLDAIKNLYVVGQFSGTTNVDSTASNYTLTANGNGGYAFLSNYDENGIFITAWAYGGIAPADNANCFSVAVSDNNIIYISGTFTSTVDFDPDIDIFNLTANQFGGGYISEFDNAGSFITAYSLSPDTGTQTFNSFSDLTFDNSNHLYETGIFAGDSVDFDLGSGSYLLTSHLAQSGSVAKYEDLSVGINKVQDSGNGLLVYPNPATDFFQINYNLKENQKAEFILFNTFGQQVKDKNLFSNKKTQSINTTDLPNGIYFWQVKIKDKNISNGKLVILK